MHYRLISERPAQRTSDDVIFTTWALRHDVDLSSDDFAGVTGMTRGLSSG